MKPAAAMVSAHIALAASPPQSSALRLVAQKDGAVQVEDFIPTLIEIKFPRGGIRAARLLAFRPEACVDAISVVECVYRSGIQRIGELIERNAADERKEHVLDKPANRIPRVFGPISGRKGKMPGLTP